MTIETKKNPFQVTIKTVYSNILPLKNFWSLVCVCIIYFLYTGKRHPDTLTSHIEPIWNGGEEITGGRMYLFILSGKYLTCLFLCFSTRSTFSTKKRSHRPETLRKTHKIRLSRFSLFECTLLDPNLQHTEELIDLFYFITFWSHYYTDPLCIKKTSLCIAHHKITCIFKSNLAYLYLLQEFLN